MIDVAEPTLLLDENICKTNIRRMAIKASEHQLNFKPHMKTHQSAEIGNWLREAGVKAITVSSVKMARYFASHGWDDITIAFPCNLRQIKEIDELAAKVNLTLLVNHLSAAKKLDRTLFNTVKAYIEIDTGSHRTGLQVSQSEEIARLIRAIKKSDKLEWLGFYSHPGHSYSARSEKEIHKVHQSVVDQAMLLKKQLSAEFGVFEICIGDTPCCSIGNNFDGIDAISPGNFVFYDLMQYQIGSCQIKDIAVAMVCPIVDKYSDRKELAIFGGAIHFSKERLQQNDLTHYGLIASQTENRWEVSDGNSYLKALSQEHGLIKCSNKIFDTYNIGDLIIILPVHSCLTANLMKELTSKGGKKIKLL